jgi:hypothetical protein
MEEGNFIKATLNEKGWLEVTVRSHGPDDLRVGGARLLDDVFNYFGAENIREFHGLWVRDSSFRENYNEYVQNLESEPEMTKEQAAWNTWIGRQLRARGFTSVEVHEEVLPRRDSPESVTPIFRR